jgi:arylsulfatase A-like enzyme
MTPEQFYQPAEVATDAAIDWVRTQPADGAPWFLFTTYMDPHDPYFRRPLDGHAVGRAFVGRPDSARVDELRELYDGEISHWDAHFGRLVETLRARPDWDRTLVIVCSDHGEEFFEHGGWWHGTTLYDEQLHVPLLVRLPGGELGGTVERRWVGLIDVAPTTARLAGATVPEGMRQGEDLFAPSSAASARVMFAEEDHEGNILRSVRFADGDDEWKLIEANARNPRGLPPRELFELRSDRGERSDRAPADRARVADGERRLGEAARRAAVGAVERSAVGLDADTLRQLQNIGYAGDDEHGEGAPTPSAGH